MGRAAKEVRAQAAELATKVSALETELNEAKSALESARTRAQKASAGEDVESLKAQIQEARSEDKKRQGELEAARKQLSDKEKETLAAKDEAVNVRKSVAIQNAAQKVGFIDPEEVTELTLKFVKLDNESGRFIVVDEYGNTRLNAAYQPMSLTEFYADYGAKKPHLVRANSRGGAGGTESKAASLDGKITLEEIFGPKSIPAKANNLAMRDPAEYKRLRRIAKERGLVY